MKFKILIITILVFNTLVSGCTTKKDIVERSVSSEENCSQIAKSIITNKAQEGYTYSSLGKIFSKRQELEKRYSTIADSVKDFKITPDLPIDTVAKLVIDPHEAILAKVLLIRKAKKTIDLTYFTFDDTPSAKLLMHELRLANKRGVKIRMMYDPVGSISRDKINKDLKSLAAIKGREIIDSDGNKTGEFAMIDIVEFNPVMNIRKHIINWHRRIYNLIASEQNKLPLVRFGWNHRSHDKILLIDGDSAEDSIVMLGGRNVSDNYYHLFEGNESPVTDTEFIIKGLTKTQENGSVKNLIEEQFNRLYFYMANSNLRNHLIKVNRDVARKEFKEMREAAKSIVGEEGVLKGKLDQMISEDYFEKDFENSLVEVVNEVQNITRTKIFATREKHKVLKNGNSILEKIFKEMESAEKTIDLVTPYFWIEDSEIDQFLKWLEKDSSRKIRIATNSIMTNDLLPSQALIENSYKRIMERVKGTKYEKQIELYSFGKIDHEMLGGKTKYGFLHAKVYMFDGKKLILSTSNIDPISRNINSEIGAAVSFKEIDSKNLVKMREFVESVINRSTLKGSDEDTQIKNHESISRSWSLLNFMGKIIFKLNLAPLL